MLVNFFFVIIIAGKNIHEADLRKTYLAQKKNQKVLDENKVLKLEKELPKLKSEKSANKDSTRFKSSRILRKEQLRRKEVKIADQNSTIKSQRTKIKNLEKSLSKLESKFNNFQCQSFGQNRAEERTNGNQ